MRFQDFIGNQEIVNLLRRRRLQSSALFVGPEGVGKKTLALAHAAYVNCKTPQDHDACGRCSSCLKAAAANHPDIRLYTASGSSIKIADMRALSKECQYRPFEGKLRFFIIDEAEKMTEEAANSILKTLEEPPETSRIVLITAYPQQLLSTIRSRCQAFYFHGLSRPEVKSCLDKKVTAQEAELRAAFSGGSIGKAFDLELERLKQDRDRMLKLFLEWNQKQSFESIYRTCEQPALRADLKTRDRTGNYLDLLGQLGEDVYFLLIGTPERVVNQDRIDDLRKLSQSVTLDWLYDFLYHVHQSKKEVDQNVHPMMCFETLWLKSRGRR